MRRLGVGLLGALVLLGAANLVGVRLGAASADSDGTSLTVTYPTVTRPGLSTPWHLEIRRSAGFPGPVTIATTSRYFASSTSTSGSRSLRAPRSGVTTSC